MSEIERKAVKSRRTRGTLERRFGRANRAPVKPSKSLEMFSDLANTREKSSASLRRRRKFCRFFDLNLDKSPSRNRTPASVWKRQIRAFPSPANRRFRRRLVRRSFSRLAVAVLSRRRRVGVFGRRNNSGRQSGDFDKRANFKTSNYLSRAATNGKQTLTLAIQRNERR